MEDFSNKKMEDKKVSVLKGIGPLVVNVVKIG